uniref:SAP30-binding protein n=1 Tax=Knipowitschia caucasica TaxID=637954 RepID=A0AAV2MTG9_KNICA
MPGCQRRRLPAPSLPPTKSQAYHFHSTLFSSSRTSEEIPGAAEAKFLRVPEFLSPPWDPGLGPLSGDARPTNIPISPLSEKIHKLYQRKLHGDFDTNSHIQKKKEFRNPSIYEKLIQFCSIDELGTNYPKDMFDPHGWSEDSYYEGLAKAQKVDMDKLEKAKKERTKIEFVTGTKKGTNPSNSAAPTSSSSTSTDAQKRKSKWDSAIPVTQPNIITTSGSLPAVVSVTTTASGTKTTVISAVGTIAKKTKQ